MQELVLVWLFGAAVIVAASLWGVVTDRRQQQIEDDTQRPAGLCVRVAAKVIDLAVINFITALGFVAAAFLEAVGTASLWTWGAAVLLAPFAYIAYFTVLTARYGQTLGKKATGIVVENGSGELLGRGRSLVRAVLDMLFFGLTYIFAGYINPLIVGITRQKRGLHDILAGSFARRTKQPLSFHIVWIAFAAWMLPAFLVMAVIRPLVVQSFYAPAASMSPTITQGDHFLANRISHHIGSIKRGDIVVFTAPASATPTGERSQFIKRIVALPGDSISIKSGYIEIDGAEFNHMDLRDLFKEFAGDARPNVKILQSGLLINGQKLGADQVADEIGLPDAKVSFNPGMVLVNGKSLNEPYTAEDPETDFDQIKIPVGMCFVMGDNRNNSSDSRMWGGLPLKDIIGKVTLRFWPFDKIGQVQ